MASIEELLRMASGGMLLAGWILLSAFGIFLYLSLRGLPREVLGARMFLNLGRVGRGFLLLSAGFLIVLLASLPSSFGVPGGRYVAFAGSVAWIVTTTLSMFYLFKSLYVPRSVRKKFGAHTTSP